MSNRTASTFFKRMLGIPSSHQVQRWIRLQKVMSRKRWFELDVEKNGPFTLWDFSFPEDAQSILLSKHERKKITESQLQQQDGNVDGTWKLVDDSMTIGGYSNATIQLIQSPQEYQQLVLQHQHEPKMGLFLPPLLNDMDEKEQLEESQPSSDLDVVKTTSKSESDPDDNSNNNKSLSTSFVPFIRWWGTLDTRVNKSHHRQNQLQPRHRDSAPSEQDTVQRSGFCSLLSPASPVMDLDGRYNGLEITCRSDGRPYALLLKVESYIPDDLYQCYIHIPPTSPGATTTTTSKLNTGEMPITSTTTTTTTRIAQDFSSTEDTFDRVVVLFHQHFVVTGRGRHRVTQRQMDQRVKIQSIGLTLMDGTNGPFVFDLARIRAVNYDDSGVVGTLD
jgi:hypothetical protein